MTDANSPDNEIEDIEHVDRILRLPEVVRLTGLSGKQLERAENAGEFPCRRRLLKSGRAIGWLHSEVMAWIRTRPKT
ncbi:MAG: AlpA family phage regulatory protein [Rhodobacteraceae bacterium]|nr:AlpA family phage regulatory protein [Paracoccaceae bacterium]